MEFFKNYPLPDWNSGFEHRKTSISQLPYEEYTGPMEKSASDTNDYKLIRLPNNLVVMCVQDTETETAAAALSVNVGSNMNPVELQGLAHFLEHMLFMGTEKYPDEDEYRTFISEHSGDSNAWTEFSSTNFYFGIANDAFEEALDRFSSFFTSPLFKKDCVDRELCAVDSEYKGLLNSDFWRSRQIECKLSDPEHPYSKFTIGNIKTLQQGAKGHGFDLHEELLKFYNKYYSSDIMKLVVYGNHSLDQLAEWAVSKFSDIKSKEDNVQRGLGHPVNAEFLGKVVYYETGWATGLSAFTNASENKGFNKFIISICATPEGLEHYEDILHAVFAYVRMLVTSGPQEWVQQDMSSMMKLDFDNEAKTDAIDWVVNYVHLVHNEYLAPKHVLSKDNAYEMFNYDDILHYLNFINPDNFRVFIGALKHKSVDCSEIEPHFGAAYHVDSLSTDLLHELASDNTHIDGLCLPEKNTFIPDDFSIKNTNMLGAAAILKPTLLKLNDNLELWFKQDDQFSSPKGRISLNIKVPNVNSSPQNWIMSNLYCDMLNSELDEDLYNSACAERLKSFKVDGTQLSMHIAKYKQSTSEWHHQLLESELAKVTPAKLQAHVDSLFDVTLTIMLMVGNFDEAEALKAAHDVQAVIKPTPNLGYDLNQPRSYNIEPGYYVYQMQVPSEDSVNSAVQSHIYLRSLIKKYQECLKSVDQEVERYLGKVYSGTYDFAHYDEMAKILQSIAKEELLEFWNKYINPSTAPAYTRIDVQAWSTKIWKPTESDIKTYSAKTLALYGCLHSEGNNTLDIGKVDEFITAAISARKEQPETSDSADTLIAKLKNASLSASGAMHTAGESAERAAHTGTSLVLAINDHETFGNYADVSHTNFATIGMDKTPDGMWLMTDYRKFQATQKMYGSVLPAEILVPKYSS
ncbi:metalloprotease [Coemansia pectinata]|uniref:Metalloprotease n=1 Tax=Coemansia pectinata TaxID=1052879 RepID=A0A9W8GUN9_9FUNG|nr:metalloprotease [Coemansia pectinata]